MKDGSEGEPQKGVREGRQDNNQVQRAVDMDSCLTSSSLEAQAHPVTGSQRPQRNKRLYISLPKLFLVITGLTITSTSTALRDGIANRDFSKVPVAGYY